jgi:hypothetical protein
VTPEEFNAQLQWALDYAKSYGGRATVSHDFLLAVADAIAERNTLKAWNDSMPVKAMNLYLGYTEPDGFAAGSDEDGFYESVEEAGVIVRRWMNESAPRKQ